MTTYFTSDLHLGHGYAAGARGFTSVEDHDRAVIGSLSWLGSRDKLFVLGDVAFPRRALTGLSEIRCIMDLILGNHDTHRLQEYLQYFNKVHGCREYKNYILTHIPIHPQEVFRYTANIHGHIHKDAATPPLDSSKHFNVNWDFHLGPVSMAGLEYQQLMTG